MNNALNIIHSTSIEEVNFFNLLIKVDYEYQKIASLINYIIRINQPGYGS